MSDQPAPLEKTMRLRYDGVCCVCGADLAARTEAVYNRTSKTVRCSSHDSEVGEQPDEDAVIVTGIPGASARREFERRAQRREQRIRAKHPKIGGLLHALTDDPQTTTAWDTGALGEERLGARLNELASEQLLVLHDRRVPGSRANIDHVAVTPSGVFVIDAKKYAGRPHLKIEGGLFRPHAEKLMVGSRDCSKLVDGVLKQVAVVSNALPEGVPVSPVLCFVEADWPLIGGAFATREVGVMWPKKLYPKLLAEGPLDGHRIREVHRVLVEALPPA